MTETQARTTIRVAQFVLDRAVFSHRGDYLALPANTPIPEGNVQIEIEAGHGDDPHDTLVRLRVFSDPESPDAPYEFDVTYVGVLKLSGPLPENFLDVIAGTGGSLLLPFAREAVANLTARGRFGPIWINPINVRAALLGAQAQGSSGLPGQQPATPEQATRAKKRLTRKASGLASKSKTRSGK